MALGRIIAAILAVVVFIALWRLLDMFLGFTFGIALWIIKLVLFLLLAYFVYWLFIGRRPSPV